MADRDPARGVRFLPCLALSARSSIGGGDPGRDAWPCKADSSLCASASHASAGAGSRLPSEQNDALAWAAGRVHGFDEQMVGVGLSLVAARRLANIHWSL
jgi:hypothetical protein